jgi:hypothetical protein
LIWCYGSFGYLRAGRSGAAPITIVGGRVVVHGGALADPAPGGRHLAARRLSLTPSLSSPVPLG